ncbi:hypothetical protein [Streptomyces sp. NPDC094471]|uniref:hypothetical protein n=1 Tax=Streptomyces sp. NPDC094471 TaxID=3155209 RepID=UPI0033295F2E
MNEGEWNLSYSAQDNYPGANLTFGLLASGIYTLSEPDAVFGDMDTADSPMPGEDGIRMGRDYQRNATLTFELGIDGSHGLVDLHWPRRPSGQSSQGIGGWTEQERIQALLRKRDQSAHQRGLDGVGMARQVWRADALRGKAGRVSSLRHTFGGRTRRVFGRPRKFAVPKSSLTRQGYTPAVADFVTVDDRFYDDTQKSEEMYDHRSVALPWRPGQAPQPQWLFLSKKTTTIKHYGEVATYPYIDIYGPCKDPKVTIASLWSVQVSLTIADGAYVRIDPRPWARTVTLVTGSTSKPVADKLTRASGRLSGMFLPPGSWTASMAYTRTVNPNLVAGPRVNIFWRDAFSWW